MRLTPHFYIALIP